MKKRKYLKRVVSLLTTVVMIISMAMTVCAKEGEVAEPTYQYTNPYVINFSGEDLEMLEEYGYEAILPLLYVSPHYGSIRIYRSNGTVTVGPATAEVMNLINTTKLEKGKTGAYASLAAYCVDAMYSAAGKEGGDHQRLNLEDATWFDDEAAGKIRAIYMNAFPYIEVEKMQEQVNAWLAANDPEAELMTDLTAAEVATVAQIAIWTIANADDGVTLDTVYNQTLSEKYATNTTLDVLKTYVCYPEGELGLDCLEEHKETTGSNMEKVYAYLKALEPVAASCAVVSEASFADEYVYVTDNGNGTYDITLTVTVDVEMQEGDSLVLTATQGEWQKNVQLTNGKNQYIFTLDDTESLGTISLEINGMQTSEGVFLFMHEQGRTFSQSMVAGDKSRLPVHAELEIEPADRVLNIFKYNPVKDGDPEGDGTNVLITDRTALENVQFSIYKVCTMEELENGTVVLAEQPTDDDIAAYCVAEKLVATVTTDVLGHAFYNFGKGSADGVYLVVEEPNAAIATPADPFFVSVPMTNPDGDGWLYTVNVYPKNNVEPAPEVDKDVTEVGNDYGTFDVDDIITYIIRGEIPAGLATAKNYALTDTLDSRLDYEGNLAAKLYTEEGTEIELTRINHYTVSVTPATEEKGASLRVTLTENGRKYVMENLGADAEGEDDVTPEIRVYFNASINSKAKMGVEIPNNAQIEYTNATGYVYTPGEVPEEDRPDVVTGGMNILKYDAADTAKFLADAQFKIARKATEDDVAEEIKTLVVNGKTENIVYVDFYVTKDLSGKKVDVAITDGKGEAVIYGLAYGEYYLVEIKAPAGYNLLSSPVTVTIDEDSHTEAEIMKVANSNTFQLPGTGGMGTTIFTMSGMMMLAAAAFILIMRKKENA